jgi:D-alanine-D-alanine ligase
MRSERVAVLMGGPSSEHDISLVSGRQVATALEARWPVIQVEIGQDGSWRFDGEACPSLGASLDRLAAGADVVFPALHGVFGEDGTVQALLEALRLPYVGSGVAASALAMDKARAKRVYAASGLPTPGFEALGAGDAARLERALDAVPGPWVIKPSASGSSVGVSFPSTRADADGEVRGHLGAGREVVIERVVKGRELTCGVLDHADGPRALPVTEIIPRGAHAFFDFAAKYTPGATDEVTPAAIPEDLARAVRDLAVRAHRALGCRDLSRTDFMLDEGAPTLLETNTLPGFTPTSLLPQAAIASGFTFEALVDHLVLRALARAT